MAANSSKLLTDIASVIANGPSAKTKAAAIAHGGPLMDYVGVTKLVQMKFVETAILLDAIISVTDSTDSTILGYLNGVKAVLRGTGNPSTAVLADLALAYAAAPNAASKAKAIAHTGPIMDWHGNVRLTQLKVQEAAVLIGFNSQASGAAKGLLAVTATDDDTTNDNLLLGISQVLV